MKTHLTLAILFVLLSSCTSNEKQAPQLPKIRSKKEVKHNIAKSEELPEVNSMQLRKTFSKLIITYPSDSASLTRFYFRTFPAETTERMQKHIKRISKLLAHQTINQYREVANDLKPLTEEIAKTNQITKKQALQFVDLYTIYDNLTGEALFSQLFTEEENHSLIRKSIQIIANSSVSDTTYISALIQLKTSIRTNVELAEQLHEFTVQAIQNNVSGFIKMYSIRPEEERDQFARHTMLWDETAPELISIFEQMKEKSNQPADQELLTELLQRISYSYAETSDR